MLCSVIIPTRDRAAALARTLEAFDERCCTGLAPEGNAGQNEIIVVDNASATPVRLPDELPTSGVPVRVMRLEENAGAAGRNVGAEASQGEWLLMLDDDSAPVDGEFAQLAREAGPEVGAIAGEVVVTDEVGQPLHREFGGLPEVFVGCGALVRRSAFLDAGGYDATLGFYAEEPDLCARLIGRGWRIEFSRRLRVLHAKSPVSRDPALVVRRLTRNTALVAHRYTPGALRDAAVEAVLDRCRRIGEQRGVPEAAAEGAREFRERARVEGAMPLPAELFDRFEGLAAVRRQLARVHAAEPIRRVRLLMPGGVIGKGVDVIERALVEIGAEVVGPGVQSDDGVEVLMPGTLSPGPMLDAADRLRAEHPGARVVLPWDAGRPTATTGRFVQAPASAAR